MNNNEINTPWRERTCGECAWRGDAQRSPGVWPRMKRNENANCGNCPYWASWTGTGSPDHMGECRQTSVAPHDTNQRWETTGANDWCGQHPDFWLDEAATRLTAHVAEMENTQLEAEHTCMWKQYSDFDDMDGVYKTECGHLWGFTEGGLVDNDTCYCPYCGGQIVEQPTEGEEEPNPNTYRKILGAHPDLPNLEHNRQEAE